MFHIKKELMLLKHKRENERKRKSITSFISDGLKRKRQDENDPSILVKRPKSSMIQLIERMTIKIKHNRKSVKKQDAEETPTNPFVLPLIESTHGDFLGLSNIDKDDSIFCLNKLEYIEFPKPPAMVVKRRKPLSRKMDSCPSKLYSFYSDENISDDDSSLPKTPTSPSQTSFNQLLLNQVEKKT